MVQDGWMWKIHHVKLCSSFVKSKGRFAQKGRPLRDQLLKGGFWNQTCSDLFWWRPNLLTCLSWYFQHDEQVDSHIFAPLAISSFSLVFHLLVDGLGTWRLGKDCLKIEEAFDIFKLSISQFYKYCGGEMGNKKSPKQKKNPIIPIGSMYGILTYIWLFLMVTYGKCR